MNRKIAVQQRKAGENVRGKLGKKYQRKAGGNTRGKPGEMSEEMLEKSQRNTGEINPQIRFSKLFFERYLISRNPTAKKSGFLQAHRPV
ncbi:hypothetical protein EO92_04845 [Methanosarcina sp. 2.H.A.1B.4]|nr:hypothetical protein EO92_04845 [Methanosarcina sp. 2.H.A.1B.4]